jgi:chromosome segregation ATPase
MHPKITMSEEIVQWLTEIRALREELAQCKGERDSAYQSSAHWRELYSTEAQQRRVEVRLARETLNQCKMEIRQLKTTGLLGSSATADAQAAMEAEVAALQTMEQLREKLVSVMQERDRAVAALKAEQEEHQRTRDNLTVAIGDAIEQLARVSRQ